MNEQLWQKLRMLPAESHAIAGEKLTPAFESAPNHRPIHRAVLLFLYGMACIQFTWFYLARIPSEIRLPAYEQGLERTPFQYRMLLMYPLSWAQGSHFCIAAAHFLTSLHGWFPLPVSPDGVAQAIIDMLSLAVAGWATTKLYRLSSRRAQLAPIVLPLMLVMCAACFAFQTHHALRFVYDLPSMAFFSVALLLIYSQANPIPFAAIFVIATVNRETTLLLLLFYGLAAFTRGNTLLKTARIVVPLGCFWIAFHLWAVHRFSSNPHAEQPRLLLNLATLAVPLSWPQLFGVLGYLLPVLAIRRKWITDPVMRIWIHTLWAWFAFMLFFGLLIEIRIFGELIPYATCALLLIAEQWLTAVFFKGDERTLRNETATSDRCGCTQG